MHLAGSGSQFPNQGLNLGCSSKSAESRHWTFREPPPPFFLCIYFYRSVIASQCSVISALQQRESATCTLSPSPTEPLPLCCVPPPGHLRTELSSFCYTATSHLSFWLLPFIPLYEWFYFLWSISKCCLDKYFQLLLLKATAVMNTQVYVALDTYTCIPKMPF